MAQSIPNSVHWHGSYVLDDGTRIQSTRRGNERRLRYRREALLRTLDACGGVKNRSVLDVGCGDGYFSFEALRAGARTVHGTDISSVEIEKARWLQKHMSSTEEVRFFQADAIRWALDVPRADVVLCLGLLYHLFELPHLINVLSMLSGDKCVIIDTDTIPLRLPLARVEWEESKSWQYGGRPVLVPTMSALAICAFAAGFTSLHVDRPGRGAPPDYASGRRLMLALSVTGRGIPLEQFVDGVRRPPDDGRSAPFSWRYRLGSAAYRTLDLVAPLLERMVGRW